MNAFIVTSKGFVSGVTFDDVSKEHVISYTQHVREAKAYKGVAANRVIEKHNIDGFVWMPFQETPGSKDWIVVESTTFWSDEEYPCWKAVSRRSHPDSDARFLKVKGKAPEDIGYSKETAIRIAKEKNNASIAALSNNIKFLEKKNEKLENNEVY